MEYVTKNKIKKLLDEVSSIEGIRAIGQTDRNCHFGFFAVSD
jgi:acid stress-induced BolA-like protein IbaG/YrbA